MLRRTAIRYRPQWATALALDYDLAAFVGAPVYNSYLYKRRGSLVQALDFDMHRARRIFQIAGAGTEGTSATHVPERINVREFPKA